MKPTGTDDQTSAGPESAVPCPWCGTKQDLTGLAVEVDSQLTCDACANRYGVSAVEIELGCPQDRVTQKITPMERSENAVLHCVACHRVFRASEGAEPTTTVGLERVP